VVTLQYQTKSKFNFFKIKIKLFTLKWKKNNSDPVRGHIAMEITLWQHLMICGSKETTFFFFWKKGKDNFIHLIFSNFRKGESNSFNMSTLLIPHAWNGGESLANWANPMALAMILNYCVAFGIIKRWGQSRFSFSFS
jgi:hypothetical protein